MTPIRGRRAAAAIALALALMGPAGSAAAVDLHLVTVTILPTVFDPPGSGTITSADGYYNCVVTYGSVSGTCSHSYLVATSAIIDWTWTPAPGSVYCVGLLCQSTPYQDSSEFATSTTQLGPGFKAVSARLSVHVVGDGQLLVNGTPAIDGDVLPFAVPTNLTISAITGSGSAWSSFGGACSGQPQPCSIPFKADSSVTVTFTSVTATPTPTLAAKPTPSLATKPPMATPSPAASGNSRTPGPSSTHNAPTGAAPSVPGPSAANEPSATPVPGGPTGDPASSAPWLVIVLAVVVLMLGAGVGWLVARRRPGPEA